jgi:hypothetical protein
MGPGVLSPGIKRPGREACHSPPCSDEVKNSGAMIIYILSCINFPDDDSYLIEIPSLVFVVKHVNTRALSFIP